MLAFAGGIDYADTLRLVEVATGQYRAVQPMSHGSIKALAFSPDGNILATGSTDTTILLWDLRRPLGSRWCAAQENAVAAGSRGVLDGLGRCRRCGGRADKAIRALAAASQAHSLPFLKNKLTPVTPVPVAVFDKLIADLDSDLFKVRSKAAAELAKYQELAVPYLAAALKSKPLSVEGRLRIQQLLDKAQHSQGVSGETLCAGSARCTEVLEHIATAEARQLVTTPCHRQRRRACL